MLKPSSVTFKMCSGIQMPRVVNQSGFFQPEKPAGPQRAILAVTDVNVTVQSLIRQMYFHYEEGLNT